MINLLITFSLILVPLIFWIGFGDGIRAPKEIASIVCLMGLTGTALTRYAMRPFKQKWMFLFMLWCAGSCVFSTYLVPTEVLTNGNSGDIAISLMMPTRLFYSCEMYYILLAFVTIYALSSIITKYSCRKIGNVAICEGAINFDMISSVVSAVILTMCLYSVIQFLGFDQIFRVGNPDLGQTADNPLFGRATLRGALAHRIVGTVGNPAILGTWLALSVPFLYHKWKKRIPHILLLIFVLVVTDSTTAKVCFVFVTMFYLISKWKSKFTPAVLSILFIASILSSYAVIFYDVGGMVKNKTVTSALNTTGRATAHYEAAKLAQDRLMFGMGLGTFEEYFTKNREMFYKMKQNSWRQMHDEYGQIWFSVGLVGLLMFIMAIFCVFKQYFTFLKWSLNPTEGVMLMASFAGYLVMSTTYFPMRVSPHSFYLVITTGLLLNQIQGE